MVANCLVKTTKSLSLTFLKGSRISFCPTPYSFMSIPFQETKKEGTQVSCLVAKQRSGRDRGDPKLIEEGVSGTHY